MSNYKSDLIAADFVINRDSELMGGEPVFVGTRVPVQALIDYLVRDYSISEFNEHFPTVEHEQIVELLNRVAGLLQTAKL